MTSTSEPGPKNCGRQNQVPPEDSGHAGQTFQPWGAAGNWEPLFYDMPFPFGLYDINPSENIKQKNNPNDAWF